MRHMRPNPRPRLRRNRAEDASFQTDTPAFRRWFGKSVVVDERGAPLVVYHGTGDGGFVEFEHSKIDKHHSGFFFTSSKEIAESYGMPKPLPRPVRHLPDLRTVVDIKRLVSSPENNFDGWRLMLGQSQQIIEPEVEDYGLEYTGMGAQVVTRFFPFWARNGATVDIGGDYYPPYTGLVSAVREAVRRGGPPTSGVYPVYLRLLNPMVVEGRGALWSHIPFERGVYKTDQLSAIAKQRGYDGVIFRDIYDSMIVQDVVSDVYVAFDPRQVKSATENVGAFDPEDTDIRRNPPRRRNPISVFVDEDHSIVRRTKAFVQEWHDRDMDRVFADMGARVDVSISGVEGPDSVSLDLLEATSPRKGAGRRALRTLLSLTDKHDLTVTLVAQPLNVGSGAPIAQADLIRFYERFGFHFDERVLDLPPHAARRIYHDFGHYQMVRFPYANTYEDNPRRWNPAKAPKAPKPPRTFRDLGAWTDWARTQGMTLRLARAGYGPVEVTDLYADMTGTGAGSRVMEALVAAADQQGMPLRLTPSGKRNITFYERFGFTVGRTAYDTAMHRTPRRR